jgi:nicotinate phosphoribosyltransferase
LPGVLLTDLYELTMLQAYFRQRMNGPAVFELFVRKLPPHRNFVLAAGSRSTGHCRPALRRRGSILPRVGFTPAFVARLPRRHGDVDALPEGTLFFADEPILRVSAPLREAQLVESRVMNLLHYETLVASKAARSVLAAPDRLLIDFGLRRAHGAEAGLLSARASYLAGFAGTATVEAGRVFGIPVYGTMAHSYVQAHADEAVAFESFARAQPYNAVFLIDTYDTERAARRVVALAPKLAGRRHRHKGLRIDSGDLAGHARRVQRDTDAAGLGAVTIVASGNLDEYRLLELVQGRAPIDSFGVGTRMNTSADAPYLDCALQAAGVRGRPRRKRSEGKATWPGCKQVFRRYTPGGRIAGDALTVATQTLPGRPLLAPFMRAGRLVDTSDALGVIRERARSELATLPDALRSLDDAVPFAVEIAPTLQALATEIDAGT